MFGKPPGCSACTGTRCARCWPTRRHQDTRHQDPPRRPKLEPFTGVIDGILEDDRQVPKKQRHTAKRIFERLRDEHGFTGQYTIVKDYVRERRRRTQEMFVPLSHAPGRRERRRRSKPSWRKPPTRPDEARVLRPDRQQLQWLPRNLDEVLAQDHAARAIWGLLEKMDLSAFYGSIKATVERPGRPTTDPQVLLALWLLGTVEGGQRPAIGPPVPRT